MKAIILANGAIHLYKRASNHLGKAPTDMGHVSLEQEPRDLSFFPTSSFIGAMWQAQEHVEDDIPGYRA